MSASQSQNSSYRRGVRRVLAITLLLNIIVVVGKLAAGLISGSLSVISDAIHSSVDSLNNIIGLIVVKYSTAGPDEGHQYGHAKFESLAAFAIAGFLLATCYEIASSAIHKLWNHTEGHPEITALTLAVMLVTIGTNVFVTLYERREGRRLKSDFLLADAIHTQSDILVSCGVLGGLFLVRAGFYWLDPLVSLGVAVVIAWNGYQIFKKTVPVLVDAAPVPITRIAQVAEGVEGVHSVHDIRSRSHGGEMFVEMHLHVTPEIERDHIRSHAITERVEHELEEAFGKVVATIHVEPLPEER